jgi:hypothetical protein
MSEFTLPVSPQPNSETAIPLPPNATATEPLEPPDKCQLQADAVRGAMADTKRAMMRLNETQEALFRCRHGVELRGSSFPADYSYHQGITIRNALALMERGLATLTEHTGIRIE